jgi:hypothetical protein
MRVFKVVIKYFTIMVLYLLCLDLSFTLLNQADTLLNVLGIFLLALQNSAIYLFIKNQFFNKTKLKQDEETI